MAKGIKDKVAVIGMGCSRFGERWDMGPEELMAEAFEGKEAPRDGKTIGEILIRAASIFAVANEIMKGVVAKFTGL